MNWRYGLILHLRHPLHRVLRNNGSLFRHLSNGMVCVVVCGLVLLGGLVLPGAEVQRGGVRRGVGWGGARRGGARRGGAGVGAGGGCDESATGSPP